MLCVPFEDGATMDDLISEFISETSESLAALDREMAALQHAPSDPAIITALLRFLRTIKSTSGFLGLPQLEALAQAGEGLLTQLRDGARPLDETAAALVFDTLDTIRRRMEYLAAHGGEAAAADTALLARLQARMENPTEARTAPIQTEPFLPRSTSPSVTAPRTAPKKIPVALSIEREPPPTTAPLPVEHPAALDHALLDRWMEMVGALVRTRNALQHAATEASSAAFTAPLQQLSAITATLHESVQQARTRARVNTPAISVMRLLTFQANGQYFALPQQVIADIFRLEPGSEYSIEILHGVTSLRLGDRRMPLMQVEEFVQTAPLPQLTQRNAHGDVLVVRMEAKEVGILVAALDALVETVVQPMSRWLNPCTLYAGTSILGDGSIALVLDTQRLVAQVHGAKLADALAETALAPPLPLTRFLLFRAGNDQPKAIPLPRVARLMMVDAAEVAHGVVAYEEGLLPIQTVVGGVVPRQGAYEVMLLISDTAMVGLVVDAVLEIIDAPFAATRRTPAHPYLGSTLLHGQVTPIVDADFYLTRVGEEVR